MSTGDIKKTIVKERPQSRNDISPVKRATPRKHSNNVRRLPDGWEVYKPLGEPIANTRLIAFKTPLNADFFRDSDQTPFQVDHLMASSGRRLGLVIDLTATTRYYNPAELKAHQIEYKKIACPGRDFNGLRDLGDQFMTTVKDFFLNNLENDLLVGVHCTHGLNRTGYLVCRYLHECLGWSIDVSVEHFNKARGHDIERTNYIDELRNNCQLHGGICQ